jgi:hypothetical protein
MLTPCALFSQQQGNISTSVLKYAPVIPNDSTYTVIKNVSGNPIPEDVLFEINLHRRKEDILWKPMEGIEILIHKLEVTE